MKGGELTNSGDLAKLVCSNSEYQSSNQTEEEDMKMDNQMR